jgi:hypothetical protein
MEVIVTGQILQRMGRKIIACYFNNIFISTMHEYLEKLKFNLISGFLAATASLIVY